MSFLSRNHQIKTCMILLMVSVGFVWVGSVSAEPPLGILGDVTVQNDSTNPVPVIIQNPVPVQNQELVEYSCFEQMSDNQDSVVCNFGEMVPLGKIFVLEFFYGRANNQSNSEDVQYRFNLENRFRFYPPPTVKSSVSSEFSANVVFQQLRSSFSHSGSNLTVFAFRRPATGPASVQARLSGYLIDAP